MIYLLDTLGIGFSASIELSNADLRQAVCRKAGEMAEIKELVNIRAANEIVEKQLKKEQKLEMNDLVRPLRQKHLEQRKYLRKQHNRAIAEVETRNNLRSSIRRRYEHYIDAEKVVEREIARAEGRIPPKQTDILFYDMPSTDAASCASDSQPQLEVA